MPRENTVDIEAQKDKQAIIDEQIAVAESLYPDDLSPEEIGQQAIKLLLANFRKVINLATEDRAFLLLLAKKYTPDAPKAVNITSTKDPAEYLYDAIAANDTLLDRAKEKAVQFGMDADEKTRMVDKLEDDNANT